MQDQTSSNPTDPATPVDENPYSPWGYEFDSSLDPAHWEGGSSQPPEEQPVRGQVFQDLEDQGGGASAAKRMMLQEIPELSEAITSGYRSREKQQEIYDQRMSHRKAAMDALIAEGKIDRSMSGLSWGDALSRVPEQNRGAFEELVFNKLRQDPNTAQHAYPVAKPGTSPHERGDAIDFSISKLQEIAHNRGMTLDQLKHRMWQYGFDFDIPNDPVHASYRGIPGPGIVGGPGATQGAGSSARPRIDKRFSYAPSVRSVLVQDRATKSASQLVESQNAINEQHAAIKKSIEDKAAAEERGLRAQENIIKLVEKQEDHNDLLRQESLNSQERFTQKLVSSAQKKYEEFDKRSEYLQARSKDPSRIFGFFDVVPEMSDGKVVGHKSEFKPFAAVATITAAIATVANAMLTIGSEGKIPMLATNIIFRLVNSDMEAQKTALTGELSRLNSDVTMLGQAFKTTQDMDSAVSLVVEKRTQLVKDLLKKAKNRAMAEDPSGDPGNRLAAIQTMMNASDVLLKSQEVKRNEKLQKIIADDYSIQRATYESLKDTEHKRFQIQLKREQLDMSERSLELQEKRLKMNIDASKSLTPDEKRKADTANSMSGDAIQILRIWERVGKEHAAKGMMHWIITRSGEPTTYANYLKDAKRAGIEAIEEKELRFIQEKANSFGPLLIRLLGEVGNMNENENLRGIEMFPSARDDYETGRDKLYTIIALTQLMGDDRFIRLPREEKRKIMMSGNKRIGEAYYQMINGKKYVDYNAASKYFGKHAFDFVRDSTRRLGYSVSPPQIRQESPKLRDPNENKKKNIIRGLEPSQTKEKP